MSGRFVTGPDAAEVWGAVTAVDDLVAGNVTVEEAGLGEHARRHPWLSAALNAARAPAFRLWTEGVEPGATVIGDASACLLVTGAQDGERGLVGLAPQEVPVALAAAVGLGPRPVPDGPPVRLASGAMAVLIGRRQAHGHGLPAAQATALQRRLDAGVRHWSVRLHAHAGALRRNVEVVDGDGGIWRVRPATDGTVELAPTTSTGALRALVALCTSGRLSRTGDR